MKYTRETYASGFLGAVAFSVLSLSQVLVGLALAKSWDGPTIAFAVMAVGSGILAVYCGREWLSEVAKRRLEARRSNPDLGAPGHTSHQVVDKENT